MGATGTDHRKPENIYRSDQLIYLTNDHDHVIVRFPNDTWSLYQRVGTFTTRRDAAKFVQDSGEGKPVRMAEEQ